MRIGIGCFRKATKDTMDKPMSIVSRLLKKMTTDGSTEEERKELTAQLLKMPKLVNYCISQKIKEKDSLAEGERVVEYRQIIFSTMTVAHFNLLNELMRWLKKEQQYVSMIAPILFYFRRNCQERLLFLLKHDCQSTDDKKTSQHECLLSLETLKVKFGRCLEEMSCRWNKTTVKSGGDHLTNREDSETSKRGSRLEEPIESRTPKEDGSLREDYGRGRNSRVQ